MKNKPKKYKNILFLILIIVIIAIFIDQRFKAVNIDDLVELSIEKNEVLPPQEFTTDGCTLWPNNFFNIDITDVCINHDMQYWAGGNAEDRKNSDTEMRNGVNEVLYPMGNVMYLGTVIFGHPLIPAPWRWGYGFDYYYKY
ncbi:hypothetical protein ACFLY7_01525 [Patescibacteria group bacterium]